MSLASYFRVWIKKFDKYKISHFLWSRFENDLYTYILLLLLKNPALGLQIFHLTKRKMGFVWQIEKEGGVRLQKYIFK